MPRKADKLASISFNLERAGALGLTALMRLHVLGDLHLEFAAIEIPRLDVDVVVLSGDIHLGREGRRWARQQFPGTPVVYVLGNHEFYRHSLPDLTETLRQESKDSHIHVLENEAVQIEGFTFLGCTLWTDFQVAPNVDAAMHAAEQMMSDYSIVQFSPENRVLRPSDTIELHRQSVGWLRKALAECNPEKTIVVTHHAPSLLSEPPFHLNSPLSGAFASSLDQLVERSRAPLWIHGHTHFNVDYQIGATRVLTNQRGYPEERCKGFDPGLVVTV
jgi:Icc-related predicted phosphoesterase